ncbi:MAG TPA: S24 family peptidase [Thermoanaerobaculia bacterium]|nr:S24 family peptidase [Thermoanaerobaculia bacterium]
MPPRSRKTTQISRILENDPDYEPYRKRAEQKQRGPAAEPSVFTVKRIAESLDTTVSDLLGEVTLDITISDRRRIRDWVEFLRQRLSLDTLDEPRSVPEYRFPIRPERFIEREFDFPQALHAWVVPDMPAAAGSSGIEADRPLLTTEVLHSIRDVRNGALQVIRVIGDSMADFFQSGYKVLVDTRLQSPRDRDVVAVYVRAEGGMIGYWREESKGQVVLDKHNPDYDPVRLGHRSEWFLVGTITKIVEAPIERR